MSSPIQETHSGGVLSVAMSPGERYGIVPRALLQDLNLGLDTRCAAAWLSSQQEGFQISVAALCRLVGISSGRWQRMARELEKNGYLTRSKSPSGLSGHWVWTITFRSVPTVPGFTVHGPTVHGPTVPAQAMDIRTPLKENNIKKTTHTTQPQPRVCVSDRSHLETQKPKSKDGFQGKPDADLQALVDLNYQVAMEAGGIKNPPGFRAHLEKLALAGQLKPPAQVAGRKKTVDETIADLLIKGGAV